jgi:hypothetical protein
MVIEGAAWLQEAGIEISFYVLLGLGGRDNWQQHIRGTARVINATAPDFVRVRRLWLYRDDSFLGGPECPLFDEIRQGTFTPQTPEGTVLELQLLLESLDPGLGTMLVCDHRNNYVQVAGVVRDDRDAMLAAVADFLRLPAAEREKHYEAVGSGI